MWSRHFHPALAWPSFNMRKGKTMARSERLRLLTPTFRVSCPDVFVKRVFQNQKEESGRYACAALFSGFKVINGRTRMEAPAAWPEKDQAKWNAIIRACNEVAIWAFKKPMKELDRAVYQLPFHRGEEKQYEGYGPGVVYFTMSAKNRRPGIVTRDGVAITQYGPEKFSMRAHRSGRLPTRNGGPCPLA